MRKAMILTLIAALAAGALAPASAEARKRTKTFSYSAPNGIHAGPVVVHVDLDSNEWGTFRVGKSERRVTISVDDDSGLPGAAQVFLDRAGNGRVCGAPGTFRVHPGDEITVGPTVGLCDDGTIAPATSGEITITFSK